MDHVAKLRDAYRQWHETRGKSVQTWLDLMAPDIVFGSLADGAPGVEFTCTHRGKEEAKRYFEGLGSEWEIVEYEPAEFIAEGDRVAMRGRCVARCKRTEKIVDMPKADFFRFRDGKIVEFFEFYDTAKILAAATGS